MSPRLPLHQPPPPPPAPACADDPAAHEPDTRPAAVRLGDRALRVSLVKYVTACKVPERAVEDVVQRALTNAWEQRAELPATRFELERWIFSITFRRSIDEHRQQKRKPLVKVKPGQDGSHEESTASPDDDPADDAAIGPTVSPTETLELREGLRLAAAEVDKHPSWKRAFGWTLRNIGGESYEKIAVADGVTEEAVSSAIKTLRTKLRMALPDVTTLFLFVALALMIYGAIHKKREEAVPQPKPEHSIVAPSPPPVSTEAIELRRRAADHCSAFEYQECLSDLDRARELDPAGDADPQVQKERAAIERGLAPARKIVH